MNSYDKLAMLRHSLMASCQNWCAHTVHGLGTRGHEAPFRSCRFICKQHHKSKLFNFLSSFFFSFVDSFRLEFGLNPRSLRSHARYVHWCHKFRFDYWIFFYIFLNDDGLNNWTWTSPLTLQFNAKCVRVAWMGGGGGSGGNMYDLHA